MALVLQDRVRETTSVVGTGDANLLGAVTGYQAFSVIGNTNTCYYTIADQGGPNWEVGIGTYSSTGPVLQRTTVLSSSNSGNLVSFTAGTKDIFVTYPSEKAVYQDETGNVTSFKFLTDTIDNTVIGGTTAAAASFTTANVSSQLNLTNASNYNLYASGAGANYMAGNLGIGATPSVVYGTLIGGNITGGSIAAGIRFQSTFQSDVSSFGRGFISIPSTVAASFTLGNLEHFGAYQGTIGAGSVVTSQYGFTAGSTLTGATNNYGFYGNIASGTGRWNLFMNGTANNYLGGSLGIGTTTLTGRVFALGGTITGATTAYGILNASQVQSDVTSAIYNRTTLGTQATAFTLTAAYHYQAAQGTIGASSSVTSQFGFNVTNSLTGATNNYGFYGDIAAATGRYNLYMAGTADNYLAGSLGIGSTSLTGFNLRVGKQLTGATSAFAIRYDGTIQSDVTGTSYIYSSQLNTQATTFTAGSVHHYSALQGTIGAGSTVTSQFGFVADSGLTGATYNYGFFGNIAAGTNRYNLYMNGTADNFLAGSLGIGGVPVAAQNIRLVKTLTGAVNAYNFVNQSIIQSDVTTAAYLNYSGLNTAAAAFTLSNAIHFYANQETLGAGSTITAQHGFLAQSSITGATNNYAFRGAIAAATGRYNLYMDGTADNYLAGRLGIGGAVTTGEIVAIRNTAETTATVFGLRNVSNINQATTTTAYGILDQTQILSPAALTSLFRFRAAQGSFTGTVTTQYGFAADSSMISATNNYGFYGNIAAATGRYNLYMEGTASNYLAGNLGIKSTAATDRTLALGGTITGATTAYGVVSNGQVQSDVTNAAVNYRSVATTAAAAFTVPSYYHFFTTNGTIGAGSAITSQNGYYVDSSMSGGTNNYGFYGNIAAATGRYNLYMGGTADNYLAGGLGIGSLIGAGANLVIARALTGAINSYSAYNAPTIQSDVTSLAVTYLSFPATQAASFTLGQLRHFQASQSTFGASSAVTTQYGYFADATLTGATNNYGFYGNIAAATGRYNLYMNGTADNFLNGNLGVGVLSAFGNVKFSVAGGGSDAATWNVRYSADASGYENLFLKSRGTGVYSPAIVQSADRLGTIRFAGWDGAAYTGAASIAAEVDGTPGANDMPGRLIFSTTADGAASPTERMRIDNAGRVGIGGSAGSDTALGIYGTARGTGVVNYGYRSFITVPSTNTTLFTNYESASVTQAASFTLANYLHFAATQNSIGAGSSVTVQAGFRADAGLTGATNNYGFRGNLAAATGRYNLYMDGTADNYLAGGLGVGTTVVTGYGIHVGRALTGSTYAEGVTVDSTIQSDVVNRADMFFSAPSTQAASFTLNTLQHFYAYQNTIGAGSTVTNQLGFKAESTITGATNNYGFRSEIAAATGRWNLYMGGTAQNYLAGSLGIGTASVPTGQTYLRVDGNNLTNANIYLIDTQTTIPSTATTFTGIRSVAATAAASFTLTQLQHFNATQTTIGAGSTVNNQYGFLTDGSLTGATNNFGFYGGIAAATGRYNLYMVGTADNYLAGNVGIGAIPGSTKFKVVSADNSVACLFTGATIGFRFGFNSTNAAIEGVDSTGVTSYQQLSLGGSSVRFTIAGVQKAILDSSFNFLLTGAGGLGYGTGSGGAVTQATSRTTGVTLDKTNGAITLVSAAGSATYQTFTVTNSTVAATDTVNICQKSGTDKYIVLVTNVAAGSFQITFATTGGTTTEQPVFNFAVIKAVTA